MDFSKRSPGNGPAEYGEIVKITGECGVMSIECAMIVYDGF